MEIIFNMEICLENSPEDPRVVWRETDAVAARGFEGVRRLECIDLHIDRNTFNCLIQFQ